MESIQFKKYAKALHNSLLRIFHRELEDPLLRRVTINHLRVNRNRTFVTVYLDLENTSNPQLVLRKLNSLGGFFRRLLGSEFSRYRVPSLRFVNDDCVANANRVEGLIRDSMASPDGKGG